MSKQQVDNITAKILEKISKNLQSFYTLLHKCLTFLYHLKRKENENQSLYYGCSFFARKKKYPTDEPIIKENELGLYQKI